MRSSKPRAASPPSLHATGRRSTDNADGISRGLSHAAGRSGPQKVEVAMERPIGNALRAFSRVWFCSGAELNGDHDGLDRTLAWTERTRAQHDRKSDRCPSDLTAEEWAVVRPLLPGPNRLGPPRRVDLQRMWKQSKTVRRPVARGRSCPARSRRSRPRGPKTTAGATAACSPRSTGFLWRRRAGRRDERRNRRPARSTARV
jgi:putative transposase